MNMKKIIYLIITVIFLNILTINGFAIEEINDIWNNLDDNTIDYLQELGIDEISFDDLFQITPNRILKFIFDLSFDKIGKLKSNFALLFLIIIITSVASAFLKENNQYNNIKDYICILVIMSFLMEPLSRILIDAATVIKTSGIFINSYLPVMTSIIIASRSPGLAITYNSFTLFISNIILVFSDKIFVPMIKLIYSLNLVSVFSTDDFCLRSIKGIKKIITIVLSLFSTIFTGLLTTQSILTSSSDSLVLKGIKFVSGTFIPIVGGGIGDTLSSVFSSFLIMKNTLGVFIIVVIMVINLPVIMNLLIWYFFFLTCSIISSLFSLTNISKILDNLASIISLINIIVIFITFILIITTGIIIVMGKQ